MRVSGRRRARSRAGRARPRAAPRPSGWRARPPRSRARRGRARRARPRPARRARARAPARGAREPPRGRRRPPPARAASTDAASASALRPAAAQCGASSAGARGAAARELVGEPRVQLLALAGQDRRVDGLGQQRVAEAEAAGRLLGDEDAVLDRLAQRLAHVALRKSPRPRGAAGSRRRVRRPRPARSRPCVRPSSRATRCSSRSRRPRGSSPRSVAGGGEELLGEERVALGAGDDRVRQRRGSGASARAASSAASSSRVERPELEHERRARAPDAVGEPAHRARPTRARPAR